MNAVNAEEPPASPAPRRPASAPEASADLAVPGGCPFLVASAGGWRLSSPSRDHRCAAFAPAAPLSPEKQQRLCLVSAHTSCATYLASVAAREARLGAPPTERATRWGLARTTAVIEDPGGLRARILGALLDRRHWPAIPAVLLVTTLFTLALSGFRAGIPAVPVATSSPGAPPSAADATPGRTAQGASPRTSPAASTMPPAAPTAASTSVPSPAPTAAPVSAAPSAAPAQTFRTYVVQAGDTLSGIAGRFGVTVRALRELNGIDNPSQLSIGQVLRIPS